MDLEIEISKLKIGDYLEDEVKRLYKIYRIDSSHHYVREGFYKYALSREKITSLKFVDSNKKRRKIIMDKPVTEFFYSGDKKLPIIEVENKTPKDKNGKRQFSLLPVCVYNSLIDVVHYGKNKYYENSWKEVSTRDFADACQRHLFAYLDGETHDSESGLHHMAHVMCNAAYIVAKEFKK